MIDQKKKRKKKKKRGEVGAKVKKKRFYLRSSDRPFV